MSLTSFLKGVSLFSDLSEEELQNIQNRTELVQFIRDAIICKEGQKADSMFVIKSGIVQIFCDDGKGGRKVLTHLKRGDYFGEIALLTEEPRIASACALAETEVIKIKKDELYSVLKMAPGIALNIIRTLCGRLAKTNVQSAKEKTYNVFAVLGPDTGSGKSFFARNLALAMQTLLKKPVLLYDPNLRDDRVAKALGVSSHSNIIDELIDCERIADIQKYVVAAPCGLLTILPQENGLTDLRLKEFHTFSLMKTVLERFEFIVVDSSSMFTKVTKDIVQSCDKIIYLMSSKNVSIGGLIKHFEETRRSWQVPPEKVSYGVMRLSDDPSKQSILTELDSKFIEFEIPFDKSLVGKRDPDLQPLVVKDPQHPISQVTAIEADKILFNQTFGIMLPTFEEEPAKKDLAFRWADQCRHEMFALLRQVDVTTPFIFNGKPFHHIKGKAAKWMLNQLVPAVVDFLNRFKKEFTVDRTCFLLNENENIV
ncbi:cyclic nucleotide-binding domain-containing protein [bacterium]|nr:cyclic nucleotide-binding domain-containing protein [bacterium]